MQQNSDFSKIEDVLMKIKLFDEDINKFHYHILLLLDRKIIEVLPEDYYYSDGGDDSECATVFYNDEVSLIRLTYEGHQFIDVLHNEKVMNKIKKLTIDKAMQVGSTLAFEAVKLYLFN